MECIAKDMVIEIFQRLPVKSLVRFKCISKSWMQIIESFEFAKIHLEYHVGTKVYPEMFLLRTIDCESTEHESYIFEFHLLEHACVVNDGIAKFTTLTPPRRTCGKGLLYECSCDGMILLNYDNYRATRMDNEFILWNPTIGKFRRISYPWNKLGGYYKQACGFGFDSILQDYKIVRIAQHEYTYTLNVSVFTLKENSWRTFLACLPYEYKLHNQTTAITNGVVYFVAMKKTSQADEEGVILGFNVSTEKIMEIQPPPCKIDAYSQILKVLGGQLCAQRQKCIWSMMDNGISNSWTQIISYPPSPSVRHTVSMMPNGDILATGNCRSNLLLYERKKQEFSTVKNAECDGFSSIVRGRFLWKTLSYVESLISPDQFIT